MCAPDPPAAPNYTQAAQATSQGATQAAIASNLMAHPDVFTPLGSQTWDQTGTANVPAIGGEAAFNIPTYAQTVNLSPEGQGLYDQQMGLSKGLLGLGQGSLNQTNAALQDPMNMQSIGDIADQSYNLQTSRLDPQWEENYNRQYNQLINQGLAPGGEAYENAMRSFNQAKNDAYQQARLSSISTMPQTFQLEAAQRLQPLTELNAIRSGAQPQMPQFQPVQYAGTQGPNYLQAAGLQNAADMNLYGSQVGSYNNLMSGLFGLGSAGIGAWG